MGGASRVCRRARAAAGARSLYYPSSLPTTTLRRRLFIFLLSPSTELKSQLDHSWNIINFCSPSDWRLRRSFTSFLSSPCVLPSKTLSSFLRWSSTTEMLSSSSGVFWTDVCSVLHLHRVMRADTLIFVPLSPRRMRFFLLYQCSGEFSLQHDAHAPRNLRVVSCVFVRVTYVDPFFRW